MGYTFHVGQVWAFGSRKSAHVLLEIGKLSEKGHGNRGAVQLGNRAECPSLILAGKVGTISRKGEQG